MKRAMNLADALVDYYNAASQGVASKQFINLALALRAALRAAAKADDIRLITSAAPWKVTLFGGVSLALDKEGVPYCSARPIPEETRLHAVADHLLDIAEIHANKTYFPRVAKSVVASASSSSFAGRPVPQELHDALSSASAWVSWKFPVKWFGRAPRKVLMNTVSKALWTHVFDRKAYGTALRIFSATMTYRDYCFVVRHQEQLRARIAEAPHMAPMLAYSHADNWLQDARTALMAKGLTSAGWKWVTKQQWSTVFCLQRSLTDSWLSGSTTRFINGLADVHCPKLPRLPEVLSGYQEAKRGNYVALVRAAIVAYRSGKLKLKSIQQSWPLVRDYANHAEEGSLKGSTWASLLRRQHEWHRSVAERLVQRRRETGIHYTWAPLMPDVQSLTHLAVGLHSTEELLEEGLLLAHCVGGYDDACYRNRSRIYSIRDVHGARVATLELRKDNRLKRWKIGQLYGVGNSIIQDKLVIALANKLRVLANKAPALETKDNQVFTAQGLLGRKPANVDYTPVRAEMDVEIPW